MTKIEKKLERLWKENKYLSRSLERLQLSHLEKVRELSIVRQIGDTLSHILNLKRICSDIINTILDEIGPKNCSIMLLDRNSNELILKAAKGLNDKHVSYFKVGKDSPTKFELNKGICGLAIRKRRPIRVNNAEKFPEFLKNEESKVKISSLLALPLITQQRIVGVINLSHPLKGFFTEADERILIIIASQASLVIENAQLLIEQKRLYKEIKDSEEKYKNLFQNSVESIIILDTRGRIKSFNTEFSNIIGVSLEEALDKPLTKYFRKQRDKKYLKERRQTVLDTQVEILGETTIFANETEKIFEIKSAPVYRSGKLIGIQEIWRDVTEKKELLRQLNQSEKLASVGYLVSGIAHELNNPLAIILGYAELAEKSKELQPQVKGNLLKIISAARRIKEIIQSLMSFSGESGFERIRLDINSLIKCSLNSFESNFTNNNIKVKLELGRKVPPIMGDEQQLRHVFFHLFQNAIDSMVEKSKKGVFKISSYFQDSYAYIELIDNGSGISPAAAERIFDPFFTTKEVGKGIGLGMSISYGIINNHDGHLYFDTNYKNGAKFIIKFPTIEASEVSSLDKQLEIN